MRRRDETERGRPRLVLVSMDGLSEREMFAAARLPGFRRLLENGTSFGTLRGVYPTMTYVAHATLMTGKFPRDHGIYHNHPFQPGVPIVRQRWHWYVSELRAPTLFDLARERGLTTAAVLWPLSAGGRITWNLPEIAARPGENQTLKILNTGSPEAREALAALVAGLVRILEDVAPTLARILGLTFPTAEGDEMPVFEPSRRAAYA